MDLDKIKDKIAEGNKMLFYLNNNMLTLPWFLLSIWPKAILNFTSPVVINVHERLIGCQNKGFFCSVVGKI